VLSRNASEKLCRVRLRRGVGAYSVSVLRACLLRTIRPIRPTSKPTRIASIGKPGIPIGRKTPAVVVKTEMNVMACVNDAPMVWVIVD
jgi:hypothetical protein